MFITSLSDRILLADSLCCNLSEGQVQKCVLDGMLFSEKKWNEVSFFDCNINDASFHKISMNGNTFLHSSLMKTKFDNASVCNTDFNGDTLIKTEWNHCTLNEVRINHCTMQRLSMKNCTVEKTSFSDCECLYGSLSNCVFKDCHFDLDFNCGMNGFSGAAIQNCIFINCNFKGYPLRGINTDSCTFVNCYGELTDDAECSNTFGLGKFSANITAMPVNNRSAALNFINNWK